MKKDKKITVKINGKEQPYVEDIKINDWQKAEEEFAATSEEEQTNQIRYHVNVVKPNKKSIQSTSMFILSIVSAIMIGLLLGFILLYLMKHDDSQQISANEQPTQKDETVNEKKDEKPQATKAIQKKLEPLQVVGIQANVFSTQEAAETYISELQASNQTSATIIEQNAQYSVITGIRQTIEDAKQMIEKEREKLGDLYAKELMKDGKEYTFQSEENFNKYKEMIETYNDVIAQVHKARLTQSVDETTIESVLKQLQIKEDAFEKELMQKQGYLLEATTLLKEWTSTTSDSALVEVEQALLNFMKEY